MRAAISLFSSMILAGCGAADGTVRLSLTDAPLDGVTAVNVTISSVEVHQPPEDGDGQPGGQQGGGSQEGWSTVLEEERSFDLLQLRDGVKASLGEAVLPEGKITQIRLILSPTAAPTVVDAAGEHELSIPSGYMSGIKLTGCFSIVAGETSDITLDFDAAESILSDGAGGYQMRPTIHVMERGTCGDGQTWQQESASGS